MSRLFVTDSPVPIYEFDLTEVISDVAPSVVFIRPKMDVATRAKVTSELFTLSKDNNSVEARLGANELALLIHNIVRWDGPLFLDDQGRPIPCTPEQISKFDPTDPFIAKISDEISKRNKSPKAPEASPTNSTSANAGEVASNPSKQSISVQLATTTPRSPLRSAMDGRLIRSDGSTPTILTNSSDD